MFKDEYKKALDNLHPDKQVKENIEKLLEEDEKKVIKVTFPYKRIIAAAASIAIILGAVYFGTKAPTTPATTQNESSSTQSETAKDDSIGIGYKKLYKALSSIKEREITLYAVDKGQGLTEDFIEEAFTDDVADDVIQSRPGTTKNENTGSATAQSDTTKYNSADKNSGENEEYSGTNTQFEDVDEADVVKTDGKYIYVCKSEYKDGAQLAKVAIYKAGGADTKKIKTLNIENEYSEYNRSHLVEMYVNNNRLITITTTIVGKIDGSHNATQYTVYDTSTPEFKQISYGMQEGHYCSSRLSGGRLYIVTNKYIKVADIKEKDVSTYVPACYVKEDKNYVSSDCIVAPQNSDDSSVLVVGSYNAKTASQISSVAVLGGGNNVYMDNENLIVSEYQYPYFDTKSRVDSTDLLLFKIKDGKLQYKCVGNVKGSLLNQFSMDVYNGYLRVCTTVTHKKVNEVNKGGYIYTYNDTTTTNSLYVLSLDKMREVGAIENLAEDERIYSARFTGDIGYFVTFRETDPLFAVDLKNPQKPKILSALKIDGFSSYLHPFGEGKLLGFGYNTENSVTTSLKLTMFDTTDPTDVKEIITETVSDGDSYAPGTNEHKALFVDVEKGLFGFHLLNHNSLDNENNGEYRIYEYKNDKFSLVTNLKMPYEYTTRGLYIGENFYVCSDKFVKVYKMSDFSQIANITE